MKYLLNTYRKVVKWYFTRKYNKRPPEMVKYWKWSNDARLAKVGRGPDGSFFMEIQGEDLPYPGFPRGHILSASLSKLKHEVKNQIFNDSWKKLEENQEDQKVIDDIKGPILDSILSISESQRFNRAPVDRMVPPVREMHRSWEEVVKGHPQEYKLNLLKECLFFILQEDDAYRFRVQWLVEYFNPSSWVWRVFHRSIIQAFREALEFLEHAEMVDDMKGRIRLLRRILMLILEDRGIQELFLRFCKETDWEKVKLSRADKYYLRGKYFKCDYKIYDY